MSCGYSTLKFEEKYQAKYNKTLQEALIEASLKSTSFKEAVLRVGISAPSLKKYAKHYGVKFKCAPRHHFVFKRTSSPN